MRDQTASQGGVVLTMRNCELGYNTAATTQARRAMPADSTPWSTHGPERLAACFRPLLSLC